MDNKQASIGIKFDDILLPKKNIDMKKWSVIACDQFTSEPEYWEEVKEITQKSPSTINLIFPEVFLETETQDQKEERISNINNAMEMYSNKHEIFELHTTCAIYIDRKTSHVPSRKGLVLAVDLEKYDYSKGSQSLIRATEGTIIDRLPPRMKVRRNAILESPHIMLLIDDPERTVIEPLSQNTNRLEKVYDFDLMLNGGHISGYKISDKEIMDNITRALNSLASQELFEAKYGVGKEKGVLLFAAGDGNHSLATAKACWEEIKPSLTETEMETSPARYALVEIVNVHDAGLEFEPIHRVAFNIDHNLFFESLCKFYKSNGASCEITICENQDDMQNRMKASAQEAGKHSIGYVIKDQWGIITIYNPWLNLEVGTLQVFLDEYLKEKPKVVIDYIHGFESVTKLGTKPNNIGFFLPSMNKNDLFKTVILDGALPRKTFSMGEATEKRYYIECRKIR